MKKIIFFDIDGTLFDPRLFLNNFYSSLAQIYNLGPQISDKINFIYEDVRAENGYFIPKLFLARIVAQFPQIEAGKLNGLFWNLDLFEKSMYKDTPFIKDLSKQAVFGIFSKGEEQFQKRKLLFFKNLFEEKNVYIFPNKIEKIDDVFGKYKEYKIYFVDNELEVLEEVKKKFQSVITILIDRSNKYEKANNVIKIKSLNELERII